MHTIQVGNTTIGHKQPLTIIAGPCLAESLELCMDTAKALSKQCTKMGLGFIFKASFDKANRSSIDSTRGSGLSEGLEILSQVKTTLKVPVTTDIHKPEQASLVANTVDLIQIPAFLCRQTDLLVAAAETSRPINIKKGQFMSPGEMGNVLNKVRSITHQGTPLENRIMLTERGTFFGYHRLVNDFVGLGDLMEFGCPVCFDVTHSTQMPGAGENGKTSSGRPDRAPLLARSAVAAGVHALFIETHPNPPSALSDSGTMLQLDQAISLIEKLAQLHMAIQSI